MAPSPARRPSTSLPSARRDYPEVPPPLSLPSVVRCLQPVEHPLSHDGELSARNALHRTPEHFAAVVEDTTWLLNQALAPGTRRQTVFSPSHATTRSDASASGGELLPSAKTRRQVAAQAQRAFALFRLRQFARAVRDYDACLASEPSSALLYYNRGCALYASGKKERASQDFSRALKLDCKNALYVESRAAVAKELGRFQDAIQDYAWLEALRRVAHHSPRRDSLGAHGSFSLSLNELQVSLLGLGEAAAAAPSTESQVLEWMARFLQRSPRSRRHRDVLEAAQLARAWSFFRDMTPLMVEQCLAEAVYARFEPEAVVVAQGARATHFLVVLSPSAAFVKNVDASGISKLRELTKLSQGDAVGADARAPADGSLRTVRAALLQPPPRALARARLGSLRLLLDSPSLLALLADDGDEDPATATASDDELLPAAPASWTCLEPVHCLLLAGEAYREILREHEEAVLEDRAAFLRGCRVFQSCAGDVLTALAALSGARVDDPGRELLRAGEAVSQLSVVRRGVCQVRKSVRVAAPSLPPLKDDGSWVLDNGWMLTNPRLVAPSETSRLAPAPTATTELPVGVLASGQVFGELSVLQPGQPSPVAVRAQTRVETLVLAQRHLRRLRVQYHSGAMNALQESLLFHNPPQQKLAQLQRDAERWDARRRRVLRELAPARKAARRAPGKK